MKYSLCADIMFVGVGEHGPMWPDTDGIIAALELAKKNGLDGVEIFSLRNRDLKKIREKADELGLKIFSAVSDGATWLGDPAKKDALIESFREEVKLANELGCPKLVLNADAYAKDLSREEVLKVMEETLRALAPIAADGGIEILVEPLTGGFFQSAKEAAGLIEATGAPNVKMIYDIFHFQNIEGKLSESLKAYLPLIGDVHGAGSPMRGELTVGEVNYPFLLDTLKELGYDGNFCLEFFTFQGREEKVAASCSILR